MTTPQRPVTSVTVIAIAGDSDGVSQMNALPVDLLTEAISDGIRHQARRLAVSCPDCGNQSAGRCDHHQAVTRQLDEYRSLLEALGETP